jgi:hypothetical protein
MKTTLPKRAAGAPSRRRVYCKLLSSSTLAPLFNSLFTLGEDLDWRSFLLPRPLPLGKWHAILLSGAVWGSCCPVGVCLLCGVQVEKD